MNDVDTQLRDRLFLTRLQRELGHQRVRRESRVTRRLHEELHELYDRSRRLRQRARWLTRTHQPLPHVVKG